MSDVKRFKPGPARHLVNAGLVLMAFGVVAMATQPTVPERVPAALGLVVVATLAWMQNRAPLVAHEDALVVRHGFRERPVPWEELEDVQIVRTEHLLPWHVIELKHADGQKSTVSGTMAWPRSSRLAANAAAVRRLISQRSCA